jgi:radical SAM protein with 4Fe4S-binding SPASM domain
LRSQGVTLHAQTLVHRQNLPDLRRIIELCIGMGVRAWSAKFLMPAGRGKGLAEACLTASEHESLQALLEGARSDYRDTIAIEAPQRDYALNYAGGDGEPSDEPLSCGAGVTTCGLTPTGQLLACSYLQDDAWVSEPVSAETFSEVWSRSRIFVPFRGLRKSSLKACTACTHLDRCRGGCRARAYLSSGDFFARDCRGDS